MASLDIFCSHHLNLKNKITKIEHKKIFCGPSKICARWVNMLILSSYFHNKPNNVFSDSILFHLYHLPQVVLVILLECL